MFLKSLKHFVFCQLPIDSFRRGFNRLHIMSHFNAYQASFEGQRKCYFIHRSRHTSSETMSSLIGQSLKPGRGTSYSATSWCLPLLTSRSKGTKASSWGRDGGLGGSPSTEPRRTRTHILESVDAGALGPRERGAGGLWGVEPKDDVL